jgi:hypothetical protein
MIVLNKYASLLSHLRLARDSESVKLYELLSKLAFTIIKTEGRLALFTRGLTRRSYQLSLTTGQLPSHRLPCAGVTLQFVRRGWHQPWRRNHCTGTSFRYPKRCGPCPLMAMRLISMMEAYLPRLYNNPAHLLKSNSPLAPSPALLLTKREPPKSWRAQSFALFFT